MQQQQQQNNKITTTWAVLQARIAAGIPAPAVAVPAVTPPALVNIELDSIWLFGEQMSDVKNYDTQTPLNERSSSAKKTSHHIGWIGAG